MARAQKTGGVLAFNVRVSLEQNKTASIVLQTISSFFTNDLPQFLTTPFGFYDIDHIKALITQSGLNDVTCHTVSEEIEIPEAARISKGFVEGNPGVLEINERATVAASVVTKATTDALEKVYGLSPLKLAFQEIVFTATKTRGVRISAGFVNDFSFFRNKFQCSVLPAVSLRQRHKLEKTTPVLLAVRRVHHF